MSTRVLTQPEISPFLSPYLNGGYQGERVRLLRVTLESGRAECDIAVENAFVASETGDYHLTVFSAIAAVSQLAIIYGCWDHHLTSKQGEHYLRSIDLQCRREIKAPFVKCELSLRAKKTIRDAIFYNGHINIHDGSFVGTAAFIMPKPAR